MPYLDKEGLKKISFGGIIPIYMLVKLYLFESEFFMKRFIDDVKKFWNYTIFSTKADLKAEVAGSYLSWIWWFLDPLLYMLVYSFVAVIVFGSSEPYFPVFVFIGLNSWHFFSKTVKANVTIVSKKKGIVTKVYIPKFTFILEQICLYGFKMLVSFLLTIVFMVYYQVPVDFRVLWMIPLWIELALITFALSTFLLHFGVFVEDLSNIVTVALQLGFYMSGIFYNIETRIGRKSELIASILTKCNPVALIMSDMRNVLIYQKDPHYLALAIWFLVGLALAAIGVKIIYKHENSYVKII